MSVNQFLNGKLNLIAGAGGGSVIADDNTFTGTTAEVEAAIAEGLIEDDTIVFITDDVEEGENEEITIEVLDTYDEIMANTELGKVAGAAGVKEGFETVNENFGGVRFGIDGEGNYGYFKGDDTFVPFRSGEITVHYDSWILAGGLNPTEYATLDELLEDEAAIRTLMTKKTAVDVLTILDAEELDTIIRHRYAAKWINYREYAYSTLSAIDDIKDIMDETGMYGMYITAESKVQSLVPVLNSNTGSDGGEVITNGTYDSRFEGWYAFDGKGRNSGQWTSPNTMPSYIGYKFTKPTCVKKVFLSSNNTQGGTIQASNDGSTWTNLKNVSYESQDYTEEIDNKSYYLYYRVNITSAKADYQNRILASFNEIQFYGYQLEALVPTMTSNTAPEGEVIYSSIYQDSWPAYKVFDADKTSDSSRWIAAGNTNEYIGYRFTNPVYAEYVELIAYNSTTNIPKDFKVQASNDNNIWIDLYEEFSNTSASKFIKLNNDKKYIYYRILIMSTGGHSVQFHSIQFYGAELWQPKGLVPVMTSNTAPYGEVGYSTLGNNLAGFEGYRAFDGDESTAHANESGKYLQYKFVNPTCVTRFKISHKTLTSFTLQGSNDGSIWSNIKAYTTASSSVITTDYVDCSVNADYYLYYRLNNIIGTTPWGSTTIWYIPEFQFYGRQLEALIPSMTSNTTPMGVVSANSYNTESNLLPYRAFDGNDSTHYQTEYQELIENYYIKYEFPKEQSTSALLIKAQSNDDDYYNVMLQGSNDNSKWDNLTDKIYITGRTIKSYYTTLNNSKSYKYYRLICTDSKNPYMCYRGKYGLGLYTFQLYGAPDYESRTYIYDHGVELTPIKVGGCSATYGTETIETDRLKIANTATALPTTEGTVFPQIYCTELIDTTNFKTCRVKTGLLLNYGNSTKFGNIVICTKVPAKRKDGGEISYAGVTNTNDCIDISSINGTYYIYIQGNGENQIFTVTEWWLE